MTDDARQIEYVRRRAFDLLLLRDGLAFSAAWLVLWGCAALIVRLTTTATGSLLAIGGLGICFCLAFAAVRAWRRRPSRTAVRALLDKTNRRGGLIMAAESAELGDWAETARSNVRTPRLQWHGKRRIAGALWAGVFAVVAFVVPIKRDAMARDKRLDVSSLTDEVRAAVDILEEEDVLTEEEADQWEADLDAVEEDAAGEDPAKTWEALDHLQRRLQELADETARQDMASAEQVAHDQALAAALETTADELAPDTVQEAMDALSRRLLKTMAENRLVEGALDSELAEKVRAGEPLTSAELGRCSACLGAAGEALRERLARLAKEGLLDPDAVARMARLSEDDLQAALKALAACDAAGLSAEDLLAIAAQCATPGQGAPTRGRGDAPMTWKDPSSTEAVDFNEQQLNPATAGELTDARLVGLSSGNPEEGAGELRTDQGRVLAAGRERGAATAERSVLPRHRRAVERYFKREQ